MSHRFWITATCLLFAPLLVRADDPKALGTVNALWADFDPRKDALDAKSVREWDQEGIVYRYVTYHIGNFKGKPARMAGFFAFPKGQKKLPGLLHIHGGGQRAMLKEVEFYAKRGYACLSINWGGREMESAKDGDRVLTEAALAVLKNENPDLLFLYFGHLDSVGHGYGFHPKSPKYTNGIEEIDDHLIRIFKALDARPKRATEDWLVLFFTDHGGQGRGHGGGRTVPEIRMGFLIVHGDGAQKGKIADKVSNADIVPTALTHLGIAIDANWRLEGRAVGLKKRDR